MLSYPIEFTHNVYFFPSESRDKEHIKTRGHSYRNASIGLSIAAFRAG